MQTVLASPPNDKIGMMVLEDELQATRRHFDLGPAGDVPPNLYATKIGDWFDKVFEQQIMPNYYVCAHPDCAHEVDNWMLRETFDAEYRAKGKTDWTCPLGHKNTVLPVEQEIVETNRL